MAVLTIHHYLDIIKSFISDVETQNSYYLWVGKPDPWLNPVGQPDDSSNNITSFHTANDSIYEHESSIYHDMIYGKRIAPINIEFLVPRYNWVANTVLSQYDQFDFDLYNSRFFVVTDNMEVFKVIDNNNGALSTVKPSLTTQTGTFQTSDGYTWKYMYTIDSNSNTLYTTTNYIPVTPNNSVVANAIPGTIDVIRVSNFGNGYPYYSGFLVASANNKSVIIDSNASYSNSYYVDSSMYLKAGYGAGQIRKIVRYDGLNKIVSVDSPFDTFATFNITNITGPDTFVAGNKLTQNVDNLAVLYTRGVFEIGDTIIQSDTGATATIITANNTVFKVTKPAGSNAFALSYPIYNTSQSGTIKSGKVNITSGNTYVTSTNTAQTSFTSNFAVNDYIRVGADANNNIRRVTAVNSSVIITDSKFGASAVANVIYNIPYVFEPTSITLTTATGIISNTNIYGVILNYSNKTNLSLNYITGEKVDMVDSSNTSQGVSGIVSYSNTSSIVLSSVTGGSFSTSFYIRGESSLQRANIDNVISYPNITISNPLGTYFNGIPVSTRDPDGNLLGGVANVLSYFVTPNQLTEYVISPTINIIGDGAGALAYSTVDTSNSSTGALTAVTVLNPGSGYTYANISVTSNTFHGSGANVYGVVAPVGGHGSDAYSELGARYAGITMSFANGLNESYKFPVYGKYRRIGIIKNPVYNDITVNLDTFERAKLSINTVSGSGFATNEYILQANTGTIAKVVYANSSFIEVKALQGTFSANLKFANGSSSNDNIIGLTSNTTANVASANVIYFTRGAGVGTVSEVTSGANAVIIATNGNTQLTLANVYGKFAISDTLYEPATNAYANVASIFISNGTIDVSSTFATNFNQTLRFPLTSNTAPFQQFERVTQAYSNASGMIISDNNEQDVVIPTTSGFAAGDVVRNSVNTASGILTFANNTYLRITAVNGSFFATQTIINTLNVNATISNSYNALVLSDIGGSALFSSGSLSGNVTGSITGSTGKCNILGNVIKYPDLVINTGEVTYLENISSPFQLSNSSQETVQIVIKF
jgi:hypothetical protein